MNIDQDFGLRNADWINSIAWDLPTDPEAFLAAIGGPDKLAHFLTLPAAEAMPPELRLALDIREMEKSLKEREYVRDERGRFAETEGEGSAISERGYGAITPENFKEFWQPRMTPADGHAWAERAGSKYTATVVHMTSTDSVAGIVGSGFHTDAIQALHENGVYFATDPDSAEFYTYKGDAAISAVVVLQNPLVLDWTDSEHMSEEAREGHFRAAALEAAGIDPESTYRSTERDPVFSTGEYYVRDSAKATTEALQAAGYDGVIIKPLWDADTDPTTGGNQLIVFDKEQAVVIGTEDLNTFRDTSPDLPDTITGRIEDAFAKEREYVRDERGRFAETEGGNGLPPTVAGPTKEGLEAATRLYPVDEDGLIPDYTAEDAENLKIQNVRENGATLLAMAETDEALKDQLTIMGDHVENTLDEGFIRNYLHVDVDSDPIEKGAAFVANALQQTWAETASDTSSNSLALQQAVADRFGVDLTGSTLFASADAESGSLYVRQAMDSWGLERDPNVDPDHPPNIGQVVDEIAASPAVKAYVESVYEKTQEYLKEQKITEVTLYRGMSGVPTIDERTPTKQTVLLNPASSFSVSDNTAWDFSSNNVGYGEDGVVLEVTIPAERIFSVAMTGPGCLSETESIVIGGPVEATVIPVDF